MAIDGPFAFTRVPDATKTVGAWWAGTASAQGSSRAVAALRETVGCPLAPVCRSEYERQVAAVRDALGEEAFAATWADGRAMTPEEAATYALA